MQQHFHCHTFLVRNNTNKYDSLGVLFMGNLLDCINVYEYDALVCAVIKLKTSELCPTVVLSGFNDVFFKECVLLNF